jgi:ABC-type dipeptide/oligopeptide/nickel transport system ATPase component
MPPKPLSTDELYSCCDPALFQFTSTEELPELEETIGQGRALNAIDFGLNLDSKGFNIFILGESGTGKSTTIKTIIRKKAADEPVPTDWCYVYNFKDPDIPLAISMEPGRASVFHKDRYRRYSNQRNMKNKRTRYSRSSRKSRSRCFRASRRKRRRKVFRSERLSAV